MDAWLLLAGAVVAALFTFLGTRLGANNAAAAAEQLDKRETRKHLQSEIHRAIEWSASDNTKLAETGTAILQSRANDPDVSASDRAAIEVAVDALLAAPRNAREQREATTFVRVVTLSELQGDV